MINKQKYKSDKSDNYWYLAWKRFSQNKAALAGSAILLIVILTAVFAVKIAPFEYFSMTFDSNLKPNNINYLGTDEFGRDMFSRLVYGSRISVFVGFFSQIVVLIIGMILGGIAGYKGGKVDILLMRIADIQFTFPPMLIALLLLGTIVSRSMFSIILVIGVTSWPTMARLVRSQVISIKKNAYFEAAECCGSSFGYILRKHVLPNISGPLIVQVTFGVANAIMIEAFLSFIGLGTPPPLPSWGGMLNASFPWIRVFPSQMIYPALCLAITLIAVNLVGDGLRDALDPKSDKYNNY